MGVLALTFLAGYIVHKEQLVPPEQYREDHERWLTGEPDELAELFAPFPASRMTARRVSRYVNSVRNQGPQCLAEPHPELFE